MTLVNWSLLGLTTQQVAYYRQKFIQNTHKHIRATGFEGKRLNWRHRKGEIEDRGLFEHFTLAKQFGAFNVQETDYIAIDLDCGEDILARYKSVCEIMGLPSFLVQSSFKQVEGCPIPGGLHLYYFSSKRVSIR